MTAKVVDFSEVEAVRTLDGRTLGDIRRKELRRIAQRLNVNWTEADSADALRAKLAPVLNRAHARREAEQRAKEAEQRPHVMSGSHVEGVLDFKRWAAENLPGNTTL